LPLDITPEQEAERKLYKSKDGELGITNDMLFGCIRGAGRYEKLGKGKKMISTVESTILPAFFDIKNDFLPFEKETSEWHVDVRYGKNEKKQSIKLIRPMFNKWAIDGIFISVNEKEAHEETIKKLFYHGGTKLGLGAFRPACNGRFGKFKVTEWERIG